MNEYSEVVDYRTTSQAVAAADDRVQVDVRKYDLANGFRQVDLRESERKVLVPGAKVRPQVELD